VGSFARTSGQFVEFVICPEGVRFGLATPSIFLPFRAQAKIDVDPDEDVDPDDVLELVLPWKSCCNEAKSAWAPDRLLDCKS
jgi:hypothetical protein